MCVLLGSRDAGRGEEAIQDLKKALGDAACKDRLQLLEIDTSSDDSVQKAAQSLNGEEIYGIVNNAGIGFGYKTEENVDVNYFGPRRVNDAFVSKLQRPGGRIVNVTSASGPMFVAGCDDDALKAQMTDPTTIDSVEQLDKLAKGVKTSNGYGVSKALLNAYTVLQAKAEPDLIINACTPGFIDTDITAGMGATNPPSKGAVPPVHLLMSDEIGKLPTGRYYGSDCVRSPLFEYRGPGDPPYKGP